MSIDQMQCTRVVCIHMRNYVLLGQFACLTTDITTNRGEMRPRKRKKNGGLKLGIDIY